MDPHLVPLTWEFNRPSVWAGVALWCLGMVWGFSPLYRRWQEQWEERIPLDPSGALASLLGLVPFLLGSLGVMVGIEISLGHSWGVSCGLIACVLGGLYELGRQDNSRSSSPD